MTRLVSDLPDFSECDEQPLDVRVLIVEDESIIAHDVAYMLEGLGYSVAGIASSAAAALAFAEKEPVDIVLMDIRIKGEMDGIDLAGELRQLYGLPVVYMTAHTDDLTLARARETEPFGYITKPMTSAHIKVALCLALRRHRIHWQSEEREASLQTAVEQLERAQHDLSRSNSTLAVLTQAVSSVLKEQVHAIGASASMLALAEPISATLEGRAYLAAVREGCQRLDSQIMALLDYFSASLLERKGAQPIQAGDPLRLAQVNLQSIIDSSQARIEAEDLPAVLVHPTALLLIFQNLLANSIRFSGERAPRVFISAEREGNFWQFTVKDNGIGFDQSQSLKIFELFQCAHGNEYTGTGLGLAMCQRLVTEHGGRIWAESKLGEGAEFHFTIPAWFTTLAA